MIRIGFICPTYAAHELDKYTRTALNSFFATTPDGVALVVDDGSKSWSTDYEKSLRSLAEQYPGRDIHFHHFRDQLGLTRSWNHALVMADKLGLDYAIAGNNDVIFTKFWYTGLLHALTNGYAMVGPLSNAPGITAKGQQEVDKYLKKFILTDDQDRLNQMADELRQEHLGKVVESPVNGFFQMASLDSWRKGMYDSGHYYKPKNTHTSKGKRNPTPYLTLNEDELQARWRRKNMKSAVVLSSFIFHYRAVTRGDKYKRGKWYRKK